MSFGGDWDRCYGSTHRFFTLMSVTKFMCRYKFFYFNFDWAAKISSGFCPLLTPDLQLP